jgi:3-isopropylmalate/(R)-2-methylmalate dehydratase small subunit
VGISAVVAESYSGKWQRVAVNSGLPALQVAGVTKTVSTNDLICVNLETGEVRNLTTGATTIGKPLPDFMRATIELGGPIQYIKQRVATMKRQSKEYEKAVSG